jgi:serine/threonine protein kinase
VASDAFRAGDRLGKYEIIRELATGGMATIYLARVSGTAGFEKLVVLKCILPALAHDRGFVSMFLDEARLAATLRHSNIAAVFDVGVEDGTYFFAMEYVHGQNARMVRIEAKQQHVRIPLEVALAIVGGTAAALGYAHERTGPSGPLNLVHRDVSLSNVLVSYEGAVKLVDFGIARANMRSSVRTRTGLRRGKAPYMSPEQCRGEVIDGRSDLFSLGTIFYELTTGRRPFFGSSDFEVMEAIVTGDPTPPSVLVDDYPQPIEDMVMRLLARSPHERYQKASALLDDLDAFIAARGMRTSGYVVAKYMKELFGETATSKFERDTMTDMGESASSHDASDEEPTGAFERAEQVDLMAHPRTVRRASPTAAAAAGDEPSQLSAFHEPTRQDPALLFDPIDARSQELLEHLDVDAPPDETLGARAYRRVETLLGRAVAFAGLGEMDKAVTAVELALDEAPRTQAVQQLLQRHIDTIIAVYEAMLEGPYRTPALVRRMNELAPVELEPRARLLLPWIDGKTSIRDLIVRSGMQRLEAYHHLCQFLLRGIIS